MGTLVRQLLKKTPPFRVISSLSVTNSNPSPQPISNFLFPLPPNSSDHDQSNSTPPPIADCKLQSPIFPSFPFGFFPGTIHPSRILDQVPEVEEEEERSEETATVWADSVKKKRKKKMNKHKLKKLRKLLRRKT